MANNFYGKAQEFILAVEIAKLCNAQWYDCAAFRTNKSMLDQAVAIDQKHVQHMVSAMADVAAYLTKTEVSFFTHTPITIVFANDMNGFANNPTGADVRDIILINRIGQELGVSSKHNSREQKSFRLSPTYNIVHILGVPFDQQFNDALKPMWADLGNNANLPWSEYKDKPLVYDTVITELTNFIKRNAENIDIRSTLRFILGAHNYYKVEHSKNNKTKITHFNIWDNNPISGQQIALPTKLIAVEQVDDITTSLSNKFTLTFGDGDGHIHSMFAFRVKNGDTKVKKSLKFEIIIRSLPQMETVIL